MTTVKRPVGTLDNPKTMEYYRLLAASTVTTGSAAAETEAAPKMSYVKLGDMSAPLLMEESGWLPGVSSGKFPPGVIGLQRGSAPDPDGRALVCILALSVVCSALSTVLHVQVNTARFPSTAASLPLCARARAL